MENKKTDGSFKYIYSAEEQEEIKRIRQKYQMQEEDEMSRLRKMDAKVTQKATAMSLVVGIIGALVMGTGMSLVMTDFGARFGMTGTAGMMTGIIIGGIGMALVIAAYPVYSKVLKKESERIGPEILRLTERLMKQ